MSSHLLRQPWMTTGPVQRLLSALGSPDVDVRFVGGAVRNAVMGLAVKEIDLATPDIPERVIERLAAAGLKTVPIGIAHGTVMAVVETETFEITTLRQDTACDGRHAVVEFTTDWHEDARRRDFTFNAMSLRADGTLFDDHGGCEDARAGRVRFVGKAEDRIIEDYLRILRLFRFFAWYGRVPLDAETLEACRKHAAGLTQLSAERVQQEVAKLLGAPSPAQALKDMKETGVLAQILPEAEGIAILDRLLALEKEANPARPQDWLRRMAALLPMGSVDDVAARLKLSNNDRDRLQTLAASEPLLDDHTDPLRLRRALYHLGASLVTERVLLAWARRPAHELSAPWRALLEVAAQWIPRSFPATGADVLALGVSPGPAVGRILAAAEEWWIGAGFEPDKVAVRERMRYLIESQKGNGSGGGPEPFVL